MSKFILRIVCLVLISLCLGFASLCLPACDNAANSPKGKVGISFSKGSASRWKKEAAFMQERANALGLDVDIRFDTSGDPEKQVVDCLELIDEGVSVLIIMPRNVKQMGEVLVYAAQKGVKIISYARAMMDGKVDLFVGYDCYKIGQSLGKHLTEKVYKGDVIVLKGDPDDFNTPLLYYGAMQYIRPLVGEDGLRIILDSYVAKWSPSEAKKLVKEAVAANNNHVDAIFAPNDKLAEASAAALQELNVTTPVVITGMDAELAALKRLVNGTQDVTVYLDLKDIAYAAVDEANNIIKRKEMRVNSVLDNDKDEKIKAYLVNGKIVTRENIDKVLIEPGYYSKEEIYGK